MQNAFKINYYFSDKIDKNLAFHVNDDLENVLSNHTLLAKKLHYQKKKLIHMKQIHSNRVKIVEDNDSFTNPPTCDAVITNRVNTPLMVMVADCSPLLFFDVKKGVIAAVHAGRAGAFSNILKNTINTFTDKFDSNLANIYVKIGPSIQSCCYEVSVEIEEQAKNLNLGFSIEKRDSKIFLNISAILLSQLQECGISIQNIKLSSECTSCNNDKYFSYRKEKKTGRFAGVIEIKS